MYKYVAEVAHMADIRCAMLAFVFPSNAEIIDVTSDKPTTTNIMPYGITVLIFWNQLRDTMSESAA